MFKNFFCNAVKRNYKGVSIKQSLESSRDQLSCPRDPRIIFQQIRLQNNQLAQQISHSQEVLKRYCTEEEFRFCGSAVSNRNIVKQGTIIVKSNTVSQAQLPVCTYQPTRVESVDKSISQESIQKSQTPSIAVKESLDGSPNLSKPELFGHFGEAVKKLVAY